MIAVAIDGPSGAGKSTLARAAAKILGFTYVDTGACYRGVAVYLVEQGVDVRNQDEVERALAGISLDLNYANGEQRVLLGETDVTGEIRTPEITEIASIISAYSGVRAWLLEFQRGLAKDRNVLMDGRDIGTVVLPNADVKIFLTANDEARAQRRHLDFIANGEEIEYNEILEDMRRRDKRDSTRRIAPLEKAEDAVLLDTTELDFEESLERILEIIKGRE